MPAPSPTTLDLVYQVVPEGPESLDNLATALSAIPLAFASGVAPFSDLVEMGVNPVSDFTTTLFVPGIGPVAQRDLKFSLLPPFVQVFLTPPLPEAPGTFQGSLVSSSPNDVEGGSGCQKLRIDYIDEDGVPQSEFVVPTGTTPVNLLNNKKVSIVQILPDEGPETAIALASNGLALPQAVINVGSTAGFPAAGTIFVTTSTGVQAVAYTGLTPNSFTGASGGTGVMSTSMPVIAAPAGLIYVYSGLMGTGVLLFQGTGPRITPVFQNFQGSIVSSSPADNGVTSDVGAHTVVINYVDALGNPHVETVTLNGTTPVDLANLDHAIIGNMTVTDVGATGSSCGIISIMSGTGGKGGLAGYLGPSFFQYFPQFMTRATSIVPPLGYGPAAGGKQTGTNWQLPGVGGIYQGTPGNTGLDPAGNPARPPNLLDGEVALVNGSPNIVFDTPQTLGKGTTMSFSTQPDVIYTLSASIVSALNATLTSNYTGSGTAGTDDAETTLITVPSDIASRFRGIYTQVIGAALVSKVIALEPAFS